MSASRAGGGPERVGRADCLRSVTVIAASFSPRVALSWVPDTLSEFAKDIARDLGKRVLGHFAAQRERFAEMAGVWNNDHGRDVPHGRDWSQER